MKCILDFNGRRLSGVRPFAVFESQRGAWQWKIVGRRQEAGGSFPFHDGAGNGHAALDEIRRALRWSRANLSTAGAAIGYFAYDFARSLEPRAFAKTSPPDDLNVPDARLIFCEELALTPQPPLPILGEGVARSDGGEGCPPAYSKAIARLQEYIAAGDIYQANYAERFSYPFSGSPAALFEYLQSTNPAPFAALLEWDDFSIVSNSPERFLKLENKVLTAQPIKGTAPRGSTPDEDIVVQRALQNSIKDRAENVMIVDLLRNDLGRVCEYGSVRVPQLFELQTFPTLHHLVSTVTGVLRADCDALDAFAAAFPCGSITGAPKIRAMQIIDELESTRRGVSFGAIGYFGLNGDMEWNVAIRTITCQNNAAHFHTGGGIVADSRAADEYSELQLKARALKEALNDLNHRGTETRRTA